MNRLFLTLLLLCATAVWGWGFVVVKQAITIYGTISFLVLRFALGTATMGVFSFRGLRWPTIKVGSGIGLVMALAFLLQTTGLQYTTATKNGLVTGLFVVFVPLWNRLLFSVRTPRPLWLALGVSVAGLGLLTNVTLGQVDRGDLLALAGAAGFGLQIALLDRHAKHHAAPLLAFVQLATALIVFALLAPLVEPLVWPPRPVWIAAAVTGVLATAGAFYAITLAQQTLSAVRVALIVALEPVFATAFGVRLLGDQLFPLQWGGAALMVGAVVIASVISPQPPRPAAPSSS